MLKIGLIGFGGTIAMVPNADGALAPAQSAEQLVEHAPGLKELGASLEVIQLSNKDSTNLNPSDWQLLIKKVIELQSKYDGLIITHGTDTMAYTSTALALALDNSLQKPIIFTGSQLPIIDPGTDAQPNLERSMKTIIEAIEAGIREVMIVFGDKVLRASRSIKTNEARFDAFDSPAWPPLAIITATGAQFNAMANQSRPKPGDSEIKNKFDTGIVSIDVRPGLEPEVVWAITESDRCTALILKSLGAGNVPSEGKYSLIPVIESTVKNGKPVIIATKFIGGRVVPDIYETGQAPLKVGAGHSGDMTDVATEVKLMWLVGQGITDPAAVKQAMLKSYIGEISQA